MWLLGLLVSIAFSFAGNEKIDFKKYNTCLTKRRAADKTYCFDRINLDDKKLLEDRFLSAVEGARKHGNPSRKKSLTKDLTDEISNIQLIQAALKKRRQNLIDLRKRTVVIRVANKK